MTGAHEATATKGTMDTRPLSRSQSSDLMALTQLSGGQPRKSDSDGVWLTVLIETPNSKNLCVDAQSHTGIAIGDEFYDFGPAHTIDEQGRVQYGAGFEEQGSPWWDAIYGTAYDAGITEYEDVDLPQILDFIQNSDQVEGSVWSIRFKVTDEQAAQVKQWWDERYDNLGTYSILPEYGMQCTSTVITSLEQAGVIPEFHNYFQAPKAALRFLSRRAVHTTGPDQGQPAQVTLLRAEGNLKSEHNPFVAFCDVMTEFADFTWQKNLDSIR